MLGCGGSLKIILVAYVLPEIVTHKLKEMNQKVTKNVYCLFQNGSSGHMIACDNPS